MREYKMGRGEHLDDRVPDLEATITDYFGSITGTKSHEGQELHVVGDPDNPVFERVVAGAMRYDNKKDTLAVEFEERPAEEVIAEGNVDAASDAVDAKNDFLREATGRDAESRRKSMKRAVEDDADTPD
jgi:hypothetical protein